MSTITCRDALARLYEFLDGELTGEKAAEIRRHLEICEACYPDLCFGRAFRDALRRAAQGQAAAPEELRKKVAELLRSLPPDRDDA